ncbi:MAG: formate/nitrite transporter family protein [Lachnospiraceae bacterium]|nr:formate/nitrite transporter family protein [Lachnospiraceae bacterium]
MNQIRTVLIKGIYAGFLIGIGGIVYLSLENKIVGALLFSFGLLTIVNQGYFLYTGKIGFAKTAEDWTSIPSIILGNFLGTALSAILARAAHLKITAEPVCQAKLSNTPSNIFLLSILCGILMYLAIDNFSKSKNHLFIIAPVMIFILSGFEHSIANMFYFSLAGMWTPKSLLYLLLMLLGNGLGAKLFHLFTPKLSS